MIGDNQSIRPILTSSSGNNPFAIDKNDFVKQSSNIANGDLLERYANGT